VLYTWNAFLVRSGASDARTSPFLLPSTLTLLFPLPRALFAQLFTAFACECKRGPVFRENIREYVRLRAHLSLSRLYTFVRVRCNTGAP